MRPSTLLVFIFILITPNILFAQKKRTEKPVTDVFDAYIQNALSTWKTPGLSVVVIKDQQVVFKKAYGVRSLVSKEPYTTSTLSTCASTTKAMTAVCMGMLVDEGKVKWDDVVSDILPEFKLESTYATAEIKVIDLFTHNTGLGNADLLWVFGYSREEIVRRMQYIPTAYSLRSSYIYQNLMYVVAGEVIQKITGKSWDEVITERIFQPLGMTNTFSEYSKIPGTSLKTTPHFKDPDLNDSIRTIRYLEEDNIGPVGGVWSCVDDMSKWLLFLQDSARVNGRRLLQPTTFAELFKPQALVTESQFYPTMQITKPHWTTYGLGWFQHDYRGKMLQFHTGSLEGLVAIAGMIPEDHMAVYIFGNLDHSEVRHALMYKAIDLWCFHDNRQDWSKDFYQLYKGRIDTTRKRDAEQIAKRVAGTHPSLPLTAYVGKYTSKLYGNATVDLVKDTLWLRLPDNFELKLEHWNYDSFRGEFNYWWLGKLFIQFTIDLDGSVTGLSLDEIPYTRETPK